MGCLAQVNSALAAGQNWAKSAAAASAPSTTKLPYSRRPSLAQVDHFCSSAWVPPVKYLRVLDTFMNSCSCQQCCGVRVTTEQGNIHREGECRGCNVQAVKACADERGSTSALMLLPHDRWTPCWRRTRRCQWSCRRLRT